MVNGFMVATSSGVIERSIAVNSTKLTISNADGVAGNASLDADQSQFALGSIGGSLSVSQISSGAAAYTPVLSSSGTAPTTITYSSQFGRWVSVGGVIHFVASVTLSAFTLGAGTGNVQISLPAAAGSFSVPGILVAQVQNATLALTAQGVNGTIASGASVATISQIITVAGVTVLPIASIGATSVITVAGSYFI